MRAEANPTASDIVPSPNNINANVDKSKGAIPKRYPRPAPETISPPKEAATENKATTSSGEQTADLPTTAISEVNINN